MSTLLPDEEITIGTYNDVAKIWAEKHHTAGFWAAELARFKELLPSGKVLEIGAGGARDAKDLIKLGYQYVGTDISEGLLAVARKELPDQTFLKQSVYELDFPDSEKFDGFWASAVLLHVPKARIDEALRRIISVVKPGAVGLISIKDGTGEGIETEKWDDSSHHKRFFAYWDKDEFVNTLKNNKFKTLDYMYRPMSERTKWHCFFVES